MATHTSNYERDGRPFYLEEVNIREPSSDIKFEKVIVEPNQFEEHNKKEGDDFRDDGSEAPTEQLNDTIDALRASSGNMNSKKSSNSNGRNTGMTGGQFTYGGDTNDRTEETNNLSDNESINSSNSNFGENPCVIEDFVRNFLLRSNMFRTLEAFQSEWFENFHLNDGPQHDIDRVANEVGLTASHSTKLVPDVYAKNESLNDKVISYAKDNEKLKAELNRLKEDYQKLAKERDFHRMHHRRVIQDKEKLFNDIRKQKNHYNNYEPTLKDLRRKYESAMKEKMLSNLERDRALAHLNTIIEEQKFRPNKPTTGGTYTTEMLGTGFREDRESGKMGPTQYNLALAREEQETINRLKESKIYEEDDVKSPQDSDWPADRRVNPNLASFKSLPKFKGVF